MPQLTKYPVMQYIAIVGGLFAEIPKNCKTKCREPVKLRKNIIDKLSGKHRITRYAICYAKLLRNRVTVGALSVSFAPPFSICPIRAGNSAETHAVLCNLQGGWFGLILETQFPQTDADFC